jgi:hypothetical protein
VLASLSVWKHPIRHLKDLAEGRRAEHKSNRKHSCNTSEVPNITWHHTQQAPPFSLSDTNTSSLLMGLPLPGQEDGYRYVALRLY